MATGLPAIAELSIEQIDIAISEIEEDKKMLVSSLNLLKDNITKTAEMADKNYISYRARCASALEAAKAIAESFGIPEAASQDIFEALEKEVAKINGDNHEAI